MQIVLITFPFIRSRALSAQVVDPPIGLVYSSVQPLLDQSSWCPTEIALWDRCSFHWKCQDPRLSEQLCGAPNRPVPHTR
ncbi:hypothetical protein BDW74DRAFT_146924 [Aspergillus multicolor]|uniref:uncharacterized protein n=1 Tax=Aspergillus multicolor TaxID=41759 RepID=UPI003CCD7777